MNNATDCRKCKAPMRSFTNLEGPFGMKISGYRCEKCGHWNNLKLRKPKQPPCPIVTK